MTAALSNYKVQPVRRKHIKPIVRMAKRLDVDHHSVRECLLEWWPCRADTDEQCHVVIDDERVVGFVEYSPDTITGGRAWHLGWLLVAKSHQGQGIGRSLLAGAERDARARGATAMYLDTSNLAQFKAARCLYRAAGYELVATITGYYSTREDRLTYKKALRAV